MDKLDLTVEMELFSYVLSVLDAWKHLKLKNKQIVSSFIVMDLGLDL